MCSDIRRRQKASDVSREHPRWLSRPAASFAEAFPGVDSIRVDVREEDIGQLVRERTLSAEAISECVDCSNPLCYNGGFVLGPTIRLMVESRRTDEDISVSCQGYEGSPKGRVKDDECMHTLTSKFTLT